MPSSDVLIFGAGAVGLGLGSALLAAGERVRFVARPATAAVLLREGLARTGLFGAHHAGPAAFAAATSLAELPGVPVAVALVATKSFDSEVAARALAGCSSQVDGDTRIVLCQNGWGNAERFLPFFDRERVFNARVITGFRRASPGQVQITVHAEPVRVGSLFGASPAPLAPLCAAITRGGIPCETSDAIAEELWAKMLYNGLLNPLGALFRVPYGALAESPRARALMAELADEIFQVMRVSGHRTHWDSAEAWLADLYGRLLPPTADHESSTLLDLRAGRRTEIDALSGAIVALADLHGLPVPTHRKILAAFNESPPPHW